jgi:LuxR family maltose regulon positive regulatory protein
VTVERIPARLIARSDLLAALDRATARRVTIISAPAGSGKTSLLRSWADLPGRPRRIAVLQVQRDQHDAQQFWLALLGAVRRATGPKSDLNPLVGTPDFNARAMADRLRSELVDAVDEIVLVIDDLHELNSRESLSELTRVLANLPPNAHAVVATRHDLRLRLHRLRLDGELAEIRATDLTFTESETRELLRSSGITLSDKGVAMLQQRTEGWVAGLRLAAIALADHPDPERFVRQFSGSDHTVAEYLLAEMLDRQPADVQQLLLRTSLLDRVNGELADLLTGRAGSERILLDLEDANAFVVSLDPHRTWFRYHHLFADLLRLELRRTLSHEIPALHRRAAEWFRQQGQIVDAIRHTQAAGDWADAARLLSDHAFSLTLDGQAQTIQSLLQAFPPGTDHPELSLVRAGGDLVHGRLDEAAAHLAVAETYADTAPPNRQHRLRVAIASVKLSLARRRGHVAGVIEQASFLTSPITGQSDEDIALDNDLRAVALMNLGIMDAWSLRLDDAEHHLQEGADLARVIGRPYLEVGCLAQLGYATKIRSFATAQRRCHEAIALADRYGWGSEWMVAPALVTLADTMTWTGEFDAGDRWRQRATHALRADTGPGIWLLLHLVTGMLHAGRDRHREALDEFGTAGRLQAQLMGRHALSSQVTGWTIATQARLGRLNDARTSLAAVTDDDATWGEIHNARAVIHLAEGNAAEALDAVTGVLDDTVRIIHDFTRVEAHLLAALAHRQRGDQRAANRATDRALSLAEPDRLILPFAMTGSGPLLDALPKHETAHAALLTDILDVVHGSSMPTRDDASTPATDELSPSELRVLRYLPTNLSRPEIASELSLSVNTVNTHIRNIYAKLQAGNRSSAVQRARELRLLAGGRAR